MRRSFSRQLLSALSAAVAVAVLAAAHAHPQAQAGARERTLFVSAVDERGEPIADLRAEDIIVREDGVRREVLRVSRATEPIDIALLADNSAAAESAMLQMREALQQFVGTMAGGNRIALVALADRPTILVDYTSDRQRLESAVGRLFAMSMSGTTFLDALIEVSRGLARRETPRAAIVAVISDGVEFSNQSHQNVIEQIEAAGAALHVIGIGHFDATGDFARRERAFVLDLGTRATGGADVTLLSPMGLDRALAILARDLSSQYKVVYGRPESLIPPETLDIASARDGVTLRGTPMRGQPGA